MGNIIFHSFVKSRLSTKRKASVLESDPDYESSEEVYDLDQYEFDAKRCAQKKKETKTTKYIYKTLFEEHQGSDITIHALNQTWHLHKLYLSQSTYFHTMFNGDWVETEKKEIDLHIDDVNVTAAALNKVFSSFYQDEILIEPEEAIPIIGAATLFQMDDLCEKCFQVMKRNVNIDTVFTYYDSSDFYSLKSLKTMAFDWLLKNLMNTVASSHAHLRQISCDLMADLIDSPHLIVIQTEFSLYVLLKKWMFLKESKCTSFEDTELDKMITEYFKNRCLTPYLNTSSGLKYQKAFLALRKNQLINHHIDVRLIESDNIMPTDWFSSVFKLQWYQMLQIEEEVDKGPSSDVSEEQFNKNCMRLGRIIKYDRETNWRWTGFNYGLDLVVNFNKGTVSLTRQMQVIPREHIDYRNLLEVLYKDKPRNIMYRISIYSLDKNGKVVRKQETGLTTISLGFRERKQVLNFDCEMKFPLIFSANFLVTTPINQENIQNFSVNVEELQSE